MIAESSPDCGALAFDCIGNFNLGLSTAEGQAFNDAVVAELKRIVSNLTVSQLMNRTDLMNCIGCRLGGRTIGESVAFPQGEGGGTSPSNWRQSTPHRLKNLPRAPRRRRAESCRLPRPRAAAGGRTLDRNRECLTVIPVL